MLRAPTGRDDEGRRIPSGFLAVDDGRSDGLTALFRPALGARQGKVVHVVVTRRLRLVRSARIIG